MSINLNYLFYYLQKESINIDKSEFLFQVQSHPNYPTLLAISDTLHFFNIENGAIQVSFSEIDLLPSQFIALLSEENNFSQPYFVERKGNNYFYTASKKKVEITKQELEARWQGIVLLLEKPELEVSTSNHKKKWVFPVALVVALLVLLFQIEANFLLKLFVVFPLIGLLFSIAALKDLFGTKSKLLNNFCNITASTSCSVVVGSDKWKFFKYISFSDLSIVFFATQFLGLLTFLLSGKSLDFFYIQEILFLGAIPIILLSLYFQKFVENKWCPICLVIITIIIAELVYLYVTIPFSFAISFSSIILFTSLSLFVSFSWSVLKNLLVNQKELKEFQFKANRFIRNYENFKSTLVSNDKMDLVHSPIVLGNKESKTEIAIITNPFCGYCKDAHNILDKILKLNRNNLRIKVLINADIDNIEEDKKILFRGLMATYLEKGEHAFLETLSKWFANPNLKDWESVFESFIDTERIDSYFKTQNQWCVDNNSFQTPSIFINSYRYPKNYDRENLEFFVNELIEDPYFH